MKVATTIVLVLAVLAFANALDISLFSEGGERAHIVRYAIRNPTTETVLMLTWDSPVDGATDSDMFEVIDRDTNVVAQYAGRIYKRVAVPPMEAFLPLTAGQIITGEMDLSQAYTFPKKGNFTAKFNAVLRWKSAHTETDVSVDQLTTRSVGDSVKPITFEVTTATIPIFGLAPTAVGYTDCTATEKNTAGAAIPVAEKDATQAYNCLSQNKCTAAYTTWFGAANSVRHSQVTGGFGNIVDRLRSRGFNINCGCKQPGTYAFVYPNDPTFTIHLCPVFWKAPSGSHQFDSQPGTLSHELAHFTKVYGTQDYAYGTTACKNLAKSDPAKAIKNSDNLEFYQESNP